MSGTTIGQAIRIARTKTGLTLQQLGDKLGVSRASLSKIELADSITFKKLEDIAGAMNMRASEIVALTEKISTNEENLLRDIVECGFLNERAYKPDGEETSIFEDICEVLGEDDPETYRASIDNGE